MSEILTFNNLTVDFSGFKAINDFSFSFLEGGVQFVIGPNGAGKTTLLDTICAKVRPTKGKIFYTPNTDRIDLSEESIESIAKCGITRKFQAPSIFEQLSVFENLELAVKAGSKLWRYLFDSNLSADEKQTIDETLEIIGLKDLSSQRAGSLSHGKKQWLEIGMAIAKTPNILLVDEPIAGMSTKERESTGQLLRTIGEKSTVIVVEHDMKFVEEFSDEVVVMHTGKLLSYGSYEKISNNQEVIDVYLGR